jgi:response regulator RpfG family c-di-GMP phosphodiesterase
MPVHGDRLDRIKLIPKPSLPGSTLDVQALLTDLMNQSLLLADDWDQLPDQVKTKILQSVTRDEVLSQLMEEGLLTMYQASRITAGKTHGLVLGNYRVLGRLGAGGMAVVFRGEHCYLRHQVAIKVLPVGPASDPRVLSRFFAEMRVVARLHHPNIIAAIDAGRMPTHNEEDPELCYFVMEYVAGQDLEEYVQINGRLPPARAVNVCHQIASALAETHKYDLVHRDIKPSNILLTTEEQAKLLDFGLARTFDTRLTQPGTVLGTLDFMAPEQARDATKVDVRADIFGLGGVLFWCLTGKLPFAPCNNPSETLLQRLSQPPPSARALVPTLPAELDSVLARMLATNPDDRYPNPKSVMNALLPFLTWDLQPFNLDSPVEERHSGEDWKPSHSLEINPEALNSGNSVIDFSLPEKSSRSPCRILLVDDEDGIRLYCRKLLESEGVSCDEARDGPEALAALAAVTYDLVLLDIRMPIMSGMEVLRTLRQSPPSPNLKIIMLSGDVTPDQMAEMLLSGADDYLSKPFSIVQLKARVQAALRLKKAQDRSIVLNGQLRSMNAELERHLGMRNGDLQRARNSLVLALAKLVQHRDSDSEAHVLRMPRYCRCLAEEASNVRIFRQEIDRNFIEMLECCAPLHDIGKVGLPDHILLKPGKLTGDERILMQAHTVMGSDTLREVAEQQGFPVAFLQMAIDITRHHHERFDGTGYPDGEIPLAARIVAIADCYDALRCRRVYKPALSHAAATQMLLESDPGHFDPALLEAFRACNEGFEHIYQQLPG